MYQEKNKYRLMALQAVWLFLVVIAGIIYVCYTWIRIENHHSEDALQIARSIEVTLPKDDLKQLEAKAGDIDKPQYRIVKNTLKEIIRVNPKARFAYIYIEQNDKLYFIADSEPENSTDYSPPGQEYTEADIAYKRSFKEGKEFIAGHITDRWGRWVSILVPITDPASGKTIAVFGLDFNAKSWGYLLLFEVIESGVLVVFLLFALFMLVRIRAKNKLLKNDITERKQAEEALRTSEARYRLLVENANEVIVVAQDGMLKFVNRMTVELFGYSEQELTSRPFPEFVHPDDRGMVVERHLKRLKGDVFQPRYAFRLVGRDGSIKWVEIGAVLIDWEGKPATLNFINDITERKQAEEALQESHERFQLANRATFNAIWDWNLQTDALWWNENFQVLFGYRAEEIELGIESWTNRIHPEDVDRIKVSIHTAIDSGKQSWSDHYRFRRKDGVYAEVEDRGYISREANGKPVRMIGAMQDITERKQAELLILVQRDLALAISTSHQLEEALSQCLDTICELSEMECGGIYLIDQDSGDLNLICHRNLSPAFIKRVSHYQADSPHTHLVLQGKPLFTRYSELDLPLDKVRKAEKLLAFAVLPLIFEKRVIGCLNLASQKLEDVSEINRQVLKTAATLIGEGIIRLQTEEELKEANQKLQKAMKSTIQAIALILEKRDPYTAGHQERMTKLACAIAEEISLSPDKIGGLYIAGIIHDIGKINIPTEILSKPGSLSEIELSLIQTHPQVGSNILKEMELPGGVSSIVLQHHERMDGSGYPSGLSGKDIILEARILAVADVVEAMASHRPYRPALGLDKAWEEITQNKGKLYDPEVVDACLKLFKEKGFKFE